MVKNATITVNELFSGIGAQKKALQRIGIKHEIVGISEIDKYAIGSYEAMYGKTYNYGDIKTIERLNYADLWTYSFPCTDISVAGRQEGINENTRSGLLYQVQRLLEIAKTDETLPKYLLLENVKNLVGKKFKQQFEEWIKYLDELGYNTYWEILNAKNYGIPQNRERVYGVSIRKDIDDGKFKFPEKEILNKRLIDVLEENVSESFYLSQKTLEYFINNSLNNEQKGNGFRFKPHNLGRAEVAFSVTTKAGSRMDDNYLLNKQIGDKPFFCFDKEGLLQVREATKKGYSVANIGDSINIEQPNSKTRRGRVGKEIAQTIMTSPKQVTIVASRGRNPQNPSDRQKGSPMVQRLEPNTQGISNTLTTVQKDNLVMEYKIVQVGNIRKTERFGGNPTDGRVYSDEGISPTICTHSGPMIFKDLRIRRLTPLECWRLMGFDDADFYKAQAAGISNTQLYKQAGNSIVVDVLEKIFSNMFIR